MDEKKDFCSNMLSWKENAALGLPTLHLRPRPGPLKNRHVNAKCPQYMSAISGVAADQSGVGSTRAVPVDPMPLHTTSTRLVAVLNDNTSPVRKMSASQVVRDPSHAGSWYSASKNQLGSQLDGWLADVKEPVACIGPQSEGQTVSELPVPGARIIIAP